MVTWEPPGSALRAEHVAAWAGAGGSLRCRCVSGVRITPAGCGGSSIGCLARPSDKGYDDETVAAVVDRLIEVGLVDDESYAQSAVRYCVGRLMGYRGAVMELARKGVDRPLAERVCDEARMSGVFEDAAWELGRRSAAKTQGMDPKVRKRRFWSSGGRKGHDAETLRAVAHELFD